MDENLWTRIIAEAENLGGDVQVIFQTKNGPSSLEKEWKEHMRGCGLRAMRNLWFPYAPYGVIEAECRDFRLFGTWILSDDEHLISVKRMDEEVKSILRGMGSNNIESGILRLFSYEMIPEG